jgi:hypothetical protein
MKKHLKLAAAAVLAALSLCTFKPVRVWASQEGAYIYHAFYISGPIVAYNAAVAWKGSDGTSWFGLNVSSGVAGGGSLPWTFRGAYTTAAIQVLAPATSNSSETLFNSTVGAPCRSSGTAAGAWVYFSTNSTSALVPCGT